MVIKTVKNSEFSGIKTARPGLNSALSQLRKGDMLVVWRLDRLGRYLHSRLYKE
jgi:DNA invertase Pin-like site-specific DNA recombinase